MKRIPTLAALVFGALLATGTHAQVVLTDSQLTYSQNFDSLNQTNTPETWTQNAASDGTAGLLGWYADTSGTLPSPFQIVGTNGGLTTTGQLKSYGATADSDRALGTLPGDTNGAMRLALRLVNGSSFTWTSVAVQYDGEQWRMSSQVNTNNQYVFAHQTFAAGLGSISAAGFTSVPELTFNTPQDGTGTAASLNGNDAANRVAGISHTLTGLNVLPGDELWIRWFDSNSTGIDHGIAVDNLAVTVIPEPSTYAALVGLGALALVLVRRRQL